MTEKIAVPARMTRAGDLGPIAPLEGDGGADDRRVTLTFSSEAPVLRGFGFEILGHAESEADLARLASGRAPLLVDHVQNIDSQVGVVESAWLEDGRGKAVVRFGQSARATEILARVRDGEITGVSVGYEIFRPVLVGEIDGERVLRVSWRPYEITLCPVPADPTVGVGRAADGEPQMRNLEIEKDISMTTPNTPAAAAETTVPAAAARGADLSADRARQREIRALGRKFKMDDATVDAALDGDVTVDAFQRSILDRMGSVEAETTRSKDAMVGLTDREVRTFSLMRAVQFLANPTDRRAREAAAFEIEVSNAAETALGRTARGLLVPADILAHQNFGRAMEVGGTGTAAALVPTEHLDGSFIGMLRKRAALTRLGVRTLTGLRGNIDIPRQTGGASAYWVGEGQAPSASDLGTGTLALAPHTLAAQVAITRRAMQQSAPSVEALVRDDLINVMALALDHCGINGSDDADAPEGLLDRNLATVLADLDAITWDDVVDLESEIAANDADVEGMKYLFNARMRGQLKKRSKAAGTAEFIMQGNQVNGYEAVVSNQAPAGDMIFGNWSDMILAMWSGLDLTVDAAALASSGGTVLRAFQDVDFGVRHLESFAHLAPAV